MSIPKGQKIALNMRIKITYRGHPGLHPAPQLCLIIGIVDMSIDEPG